MRGIPRYWGKKLKTVVSLGVILHSFVSIWDGGCTTIGYHRSLFLSLRWEQWLECLTTAQEKLQRPIHWFGAESDFAAESPFVVPRAHLAV